MSDEVFASEQVPADSDLGTTDSDLGHDDSDVSSTETQDTQTEDTQPQYDLSDIPEEYRSLVETRIQEVSKNFQSDYTRKTQTLAEERRAVEAEKQAFQDALKSVQQPQATQTNQTAPDPLVNADWDMGITEDGRPITQVMYEQFGTFVQQLVPYLAQLDGTVNTVNSHFTEQQKAQQMQKLHAEYGEFDESALIQAQQANPNVPMEFIAAKVLQDAVKESAREQAYQNKQVKQQANPVATSNAKTSPDVNTKGWDLAKHFEFAKRTGARL